MRSPFDYIKAVTETKENLFNNDPQANKEYNAFIVNKGLSYYMDTVMYANEMNRLHHMPKEWQFQFLLNSISRKKRWSKWNEKATKDKQLALVKEYFGYSNEKAKVAMSILSDEQLKQLEEKLYKGGRR